MTLTPYSLLFYVSCVSVLTGCGSGVKIAGSAVTAQTPNASTTGTAAPEVLAIAGSSLSVALDHQLLIQVETTGATARKIIWSLLPNTASSGTISQNGLYVAPSNLPPDPGVLVVATDASSKVSATRVISVTNPLPTVSSSTPEQLVIGEATHGTLSGTGFTAMTAVHIGSALIPSTFVSETSMMFDVQAVQAAAGTAALTVSNPIPGGGSAVVMVTVVPAGISRDAAARFLQQASWGATPSLITHVQTVGYAGYLREQFASKTESYSDPSFWNVPMKFWTDIEQHENSQLRTKLGWAFYKLFNSPGSTVTGIVSAVPNITVRDAFGTYTTLLTDVSLNIEMGFFFNYCCYDVIDSPSGQQPDENFGREVMQQFSIGPYLLNEDGTQMKGRDGLPLSAYSLADVRSVARSMTGLYFDSDTAWHSLDPDGLLPMVAGAASHHDESAKVLLGESVAAGQGAPAEIHSVIKILTGNPNTGRHLSAYLIHELVTSNPSPDYVKRVAAVWANDGHNVNGNIKAVVSAILLDPEARDGDNKVESNMGQFGRMRDPVSFAATITRAFGAAPISGVPLIWRQNFFANVAHENVFSAPSVFGYYSDYSTLPGTTELAPESQIYTTDASLQRAQLVAYIFGLPGVASPTPSSVNWTSWLPLAAGDGVSLVDDLSHRCFHGQMSAELRRVLLDNLQSIPSTDLTARVEQTSYLAVMSPEFAVER